MKKNKIYTAADFARYHAGTMPAGEMHELEKAALEDPFLQDALEGYAYTPSSEDDIQSLHKVLEEKQRNKKAFSLFSLSQNKWWRIAALFVVIAGASFVFYQVNYNKPHNLTALNKAQTPAEKKQDTVSQPTDSRGSRIDTTEQDKSVALLNQGPSRSSRKDKATFPSTAPVQKENPPDRKMQSTVTNNANSVSDSNYFATNSNNDEKKQNNSQAEQEFVLRGKVTDENGIPVPFANIKDEAQNKATIADNTGNFSLRSKDSSITALASSPGYDAKSFNLNNNITPTIAMNKSTSAPREVAVAEYSRTLKELKKTDASPKALSGNISAMQKAFAAPQPSIGQEKFDQYIKENLTPIYDSSNQVVTGDVLLSFSLDKKGRPLEIKVFKSTCQKCETEAIRLLKNGPAWVGEKNAQGSVIIKF